MFKHNNFARSKVDRGNTKSCMTSREFLMSVCWDWKKIIQYKLLKLNNLFEVLRSTTNAIDTCDLKKLPDNTY